jgi:hypothetical protein
VTSNHPLSRGYRLRRPLGHRVRLQVPVGGWATTVNWDAQRDGQMSEVTDARIVLVVDRADHVQLETASERVNSHYEVGGAGRRRKSARATDKGEDAVISIGNWIE